MGRPRRTATPPPDTTEGEDPAPTPVISSDGEEQLRQRLAIAEQQIGAIAAACLELSRHAWWLSSQLNRHAAGEIVSRKRLDLIQMHGDRLKDILIDLDGPRL
jgi:hypothetical protein